MESDGPKTLQEAIQVFSDYDNCRQFMTLLRWPDGVVRCPVCQSEKVGYLEKARVYCCYNGVEHPTKPKRGRKPKDAQKGQKSVKGSKFSLKVGTVFEDSAIPLQKWLPAVWLLVNDKNGISSWELSRALGVTQKSAWFMLHRIRAALKTGGLGSANYRLGGEGGPVEVDETFIGAQKKFMHRGKKLRYEIAGGIKSKTVVMGFLDRELRQVRAKIVPNIRREALQDEILQQVQHGAVVYTDQAVAYDRLHTKFVHEVVNKVESYVNGQVHVNGIENFWSCLKRTLKGTYIAVEPYHLERYLDEQMFRFNNRATKDNPLNDSDRFVYALSQIVGKRLTYKQVTGKEAETPF